MKTAFRSLLRRFDRDIFQVSALDLTVAIMHKRRLFAEQGIDLVLDVGANEGQYAGFLRRQVGYAGRIVSFEPLSSAYRSLQQASAGDALWQSRNLALGAEAGSAVIHVAANSQSSSMLGMLQAHEVSAPESTYVASEEISVSTLDREAGSLALAQRRVYLKIDTQGFERTVLDGGSASLAHIDTLELEMSFVPLYEGQALFAELAALLRAKGYAMVGIEPNFRDPSSGDILQADVVFKRARR